MFGSLKRKWNAAKQRRFQERAVEHLQMHFGDVMGPTDKKILDGPEALDALHRKYFEDAA